MECARDEFDRGDLVRRFVEDLPDCAVIILDVDGKVLTWNAGARSILSYGADEIVGQPYACLYTQEDIASALPAAALDDARDRHVGFGAMTRDDAAPAGEAGETSTKPAKPAAGNEAARILVVDDDDQIRQIALMQLASCGYRVLEASNGVDALAILARDVDIQLLFVDLNMPDMGGKAVAAEAGRLWRNLKILFASGEGEPADSSGAHFLMKPYRKKELAEKILEVLGGH